MMKGKEIMYRAKVFVYLDPCLEAYFLQIALPPNGRYSSIQILVYETISFRQLQAPASRKVFIYLDPCWRNSPRRYLFIQTLVGETNSCSFRLTKLEDICLSRLLLASPFLSDSYSLPPKGRYISIIFLVCETISSDSCSSRLTKLEEIRLSRPLFASPFPPDR